MKISNIGIILLTLMVLTKYTISLNTLTHEDGLLESGLVVDYSVVRNKIQNNDQNKKENSLFASLYVKQDFPSLARKKFESFSSSLNSIYPTTVLSEDETPAPFEYSSNTLVVYNPISQNIPLIVSTYTDPGDSEPLDQGNTLINEMQVMMPRR